MRGVIFDLDGTLVDSAASIHAAVSDLLAGAGLPGLSPAAVRAMVGNGVPVLIDRVIAASALDPDRRAEWIAAFLAHYRDRSALTLPYPGAEAALDHLTREGLALALCTNKPGTAAHQLLQALGWQDRFCSVICGDSLPRPKPDPAMLQAAAQAVGGPAVLVGDSEVDEATALAAGLPFVLFTKGYRKKPVADFAAVARFEDFADLPGLIAALG